MNGMWEHRAFKNITDGLDYLDSIDDGDGAFNIRQVKHMEARFPMVLYPLYRLQVGWFIYNNPGDTSREDCVTFNFCFELCRRP